MTGAGFGRTGFGVTGLRGGGTTGFGSGGGTTGFGSGGGITGFGGGTGAGGGLGCAGTGGGGAGAGGGVGRAACATRTGAFGPIGADDCAFCGGPFFAAGAAAVLAPGWNTIWMLGGVGAGSGGLLGKVMISAASSATCNAAENAPVWTRRLRSKSMRRRGAIGTRRPCDGLSVGIRRGLTMLSDAGLQKSRHRIAWSLAPVKPARPSLCLPTLYLPALCLPALCLPALCLVVAMRNLPEE